MPNLPKTRNLSWIANKPKHIRQHDNSKFYQSKQWRMTRKFYIKSNPLCEQCLRSKPSITKGAEMVDHIKQISKGGMMFDSKNLMSLCDRCHAIKSSSEGVEYRAGIKEYVRKK